MNDNEWWEYLRMWNPEMRKVFTLGQVELWIWEYPKGYVNTVYVKSSNNVDVCILGADHIYTSLGEL